MPFKIESNRIYYEQNGQVLAEITFPALPDGSVNIDHTFVDESLRGQGVAGHLMEQTVQTLRATGRKAVATCSYAKKWLATHEEARDILR